jgi:mitochondrial import receptor subunit TOM20
MHVWFCPSGPDYHIPAAMSFYRALRVYPSAIELIGIYEKTVPEPIFKVCLQYYLPNVSQITSSW